MSIADKYTTLTTEKIPKVYEAGYEKGKAEGGDTTEAYKQGVADGKQAEYDAFWDSYQDNGNRTDYSHAFGGLGWNNDTFKPKYSIAPTNAYMIFRQCDCDFGDFEGDLVSYLGSLGVSLDFSNAINTGYLFALASKITHIGEINAKGTGSNTVFDCCFQNCYALKTIDKLTFNQGKTAEFGTASFLNCTALENVIMEGVIANNGLNLQHSTKLSKASLENIIGCLSKDASGKTVTFSKTAVDNAFTEAEWDKILEENSNWTFSLK